MPKHINRLAFTTAAIVTMAWTGMAHAVPAIAVAGGTTLFRFDTATPGTDSASTTITGLSAGESVLGIDYRPATGTLYGLTGSGRLYTINALTGSAVLASTVTAALLGTDFDISFNPTVDRLRIVSTTGQNLRVNVDTGVVTVDGGLAYAAADRNAGQAAGVIGAGYTNQTAGAVASTALYDLDPRTGVLALQSPPNDGTLNTVGSLGVTGLTSFDIDASTGIAYAASSSGFYRVNLTTGAATLVGNFGTAGVTDIALVPTPEPMSLLLLGAGLAGLVGIRRLGTTRMGGDHAA